MVFYAESLRQFCSIPVVMKTQQSFVSVLGFGIRVANIKARNRYKEWVFGYFGRFQLEIFLWDILIIR